MVNNTFSDFCSRQHQDLIVLIGCLVVLFYGVSTLFRSFKAELIPFDKSFKQFSFVKYKFLFTPRYKNSSISNNSV